MWAVQPLLQYVGCTTTPTIYRHGVVLRHRGDVALPLHDVHNTSHRAFGETSVTYVLFL
jgi:hypothetical protein